MERAQSASANHPYDDAGRPLRLNGGRRLQGRHPQYRRAQLHLRVKVATLGRPGSARGASSGVPEARAFANSMAERIARGRATTAVELSDRLGKIDAVCHRTSDPQFRLADGAGRHTL